MKGVRDGGFAAPPESLIEFLSFPEALRSPVIVRGLVSGDVPCRGRYIYIMAYPQLSFLLIVWFFTIFPSVALYPE